jgi:hypothetical protein
MKIVARILLILAVAGAVVGISMALVGSKGARASAPRREAPAQVQAGDTNAQTGNADGEQRRGGGPGGFERGSGRSPNLFGAGELLKDLIIIALIVAIIAPIARLLGRLRSGSEKQPNADTPTSD